ncbi:hypothetical protein H1C71_003000 [Ictidomys tridecemlineatus]|nr:hypothetical protein H1C71_003000 [Ictidomys tridecemlineatus]
MDHTVVAKGIIFCLQADGVGVRCGFPLHQTGGGSALTQTGDKEPDSGGFECPGLSYSYHLFSPPCRQLGSACPEPNTVHSHGGRGEVAICLTQFFKSSVNLF